LQKNIVIVDNFFSKIECEDLINLFEIAKDKAYNSGKYESQSIPIFDKRINYIHDGFVHFKNKLVKNVSSIINVYDIKPQWAFLAKWPDGSYANEHTDTSSNETILTTVAYLNTNFSGGETWLECGTTITPKTGRILIFPGNEISHKVNPIKNGIRYSLSMWWKKSKNN
jgi:hypothetical protein